jgi:ElaA protein
MLGAVESLPHAAPFATAPRLRWQWSRLPALAAVDLYAALAARQRVFAVEQNCAYLDADGHDPHAWHLLGWADGPLPVLAAYLRVVDPGHRFAEPSIGRVLTVPPYRRVGLGRILMLEGIARTRRIWPGQPILIAAQRRLEAFYASLGFRTASAAYEEDGIPHIDMRLGADAGTAAPPGD